MDYQLHKGVIIVKKLENYIWKAVIVKYYSDTNQLITRGYYKKWPLVLKDVNKRSIKVAGKDGVVHEIKRSNLYMIWTRNEVKWWQDKTRKGEVIYVDEKNIRKRYDELKKLDSRNYFFLTLAAQILIYMAFAFSFYELVTYVKNTAPILITSQGLINNLSAVLPFLYPYYLLVTLAFTTSLWALYHQCLTEYPLIRLRRKWLGEYIDLLEIKAGISVGEEE